MTLQVIGDWMSVTSVISFQYCVSLVYVHDVYTLVTDPAQNRTCNLRIVRNMTDVLYVT